MAFRKGKKAKENESKTEIVKQDEITLGEFKEFLNKFNKEPGEYTDEELYEIGSKYKLLPSSDKKWEELVQILGVKDKNGKLKTGEAFRCWLKNRQLARGELKKNDKLLSNRTIEELDFLDFEKKTEELKQSLYKQQVKTADASRAYRALIRDEARLEEFNDKLCEAIKSLPPLENDATTYTFSLEDETQEAVLMLSDWHIGVKFHNPFNSFDTEIARKRLKKLAEDVSNYCHKYNVKVLNILVLHDLIAGSIHINGRIEQEMDVISQVTTASELLCELLVKLSVAAPIVRYRSCVDNHSRITPQLSEHIASESFTRLIDRYVAARLQNYGIEFVNDNLDPSVGMFKLMNGKVCVYEHGHLGNLNTFFQDMVCYTGEKIDYGFVGHYHNEKLKTIHTFKLFVNGSLVGMEQYALSKRLFSKPAQSLIIFDEDNVVNCSISL